MKEKELLKSKQGNIVKFVCLGLISVGAILLLLVIVISMGSYRSPSLSYILTSMFPYYGSMTLLPFLLISAFLYFVAARCSMTITDKRVYGKAAFGKQIDLPLDSISAVGTSAFNGLAVATSSGKIKFFDIANQKELYKTLSNLLIERQKNKSGEPIIEQKVQQSSADELKKYKDLLDSGIITKEEFDAKKKQLLDL